MTACADAVCHHPDSEVIAHRHFHSRRLWPVTIDNGTYPPPKAEGSVLPAARDGGLKEREPLGEPVYE
jgi:hypothetical protein